MHNINAVYAFIEGSKRMTSTSRSRMLCPQSAALLFVTFRKEIIFTLCFTDILHHPTFARSIYGNINIMNDKCITCSLVLAGSCNSRMVHSSKVYSIQSKHVQSLWMQIETPPTLAWLIKYFAHFPPEYCQHLLETYHRNLQTYHNSTTEKPDSAIPSLDTCQEASLSGPNAIVDRLKWSLNVEVFFSQILPERHSDIPNSE